MHCLYLLVDRIRQAIGTDFRDRMERAGHDAQKIGQIMRDTVRAMSRTLGTILCEACKVVGHAKCMICNKLDVGLKRIGQIVADRCKNIRCRGIQDFGNGFHGLTETVGTVIGLIGSVLNQVFVGIGQVLSHLCGGLGNQLGELFHGSGELVAMLLLGLARIGQLSETALVHHVEAVMAYLSSVAKQFCSMCGTRCLFHRFGLQPN